MAPCGYGWATGLANIALSLFSCCVLSVCWLLAAASRHVPIPGVHMYNRVCLRAMFDE